MARTPEQERNYRRRLAEEKASWAVHQARQARIDKAHSLMHSDPEKGQKLLAEVRAEEAAEREAEKKAKVRVRMADEWVKAGGDAGGLTDARFDKLYDKLVEERVVRALLGTAHRRAIRF